MWKKHDPKMSFEETRQRGKRGTLGSYRSIYGWKPTQEHASNGESLTRLTFFIRKDIYLELLDIYPRFLEDRLEPDTFG